MLKMLYKVTYRSIDGRVYTVENVKAKSEYEATSIIAHEVNFNRNYGYDFKAEFMNFA